MKLGRAVGRGLVVVLQEPSVCSAWGGLAARPPVDMGFSWRAGSPPHADRTFPDTTLVLRPLARWSPDKLGRAPERRAPHQPPSYRTVVLSALVRTLTIALVGLFCAAAWGQDPVPLSRGTYLAADGKAASIEWKPTGLSATDTGEALHLELEPKAKGTADSAPLSLVPLRLYTIAMTCRRGPGLGLVVWVKWLSAEGKPGARQMVWQLPDRFRINWFPLSPLKQTYVQRFCLPPGAKEVTLQIALTGHPDVGYNYFDLYDLTIARGAEVPFGTRLGPNLLPTGGMETVTSSGMALGWGFWGADPGAKVLEKDAQGRPAHGGQRFLSFPAGKNCILAGGVVPVQPGRAYRLSLWVRGTGDLGFGAQSLEETQGQRVDDAQVTNVHVEATDWQELSSIWFAAGLYTVSANPFMGLGPQTDLDLDDVALQLIEP